MNIFLDWINQSDVETSKYLVTPLPITKQISNVQKINSSQLKTTIDENCLMSNYSKKTLTNYKIYALNITTESVSKKNSIPTVIAFDIFCKNTDQNFAEKQLNTILHKAYYTDILEWQLNRNFIKESNCIRTTPLEIATLHGNLNIFIMLLKFLEPKNIFQNLLKRYNPLIDLQKKQIITCAFSLACRLNKLQIIEYIYSNFFDILFKSGLGNFVNEICNMQYFDKSNASVLNFLLDKIYSYITNNRSEYEFFSNTIIELMCQWSHQHKWNLIATVCINNPRVINKVYTNSDYIKKTIVTFINNTIKSDKSYIILLFIDKYNVRPLLSQTEDTVFYYKMRQGFSFLDIIAIDFPACYMAYTLINLAKSNFSINEHDDEKYSIYSCLDVAITHGKYTNACILLVFGAKSKLLHVPNLLSTKDQLAKDKIADFLSKNNPLPLNKLAALRLGIQYIKDQVSFFQAKREIAKYVSPMLASKMQSIADVFDLNLIYNTS